MNRPAFTFILLLSLIAVFSQRSASAEGVSAEEREFFETKIRPVLVKHCYECHSEGSKELGGKLLLDSQDGMLKGGESGPALIVGQVEKSLIIQALRYNDLEMPPEAPLPESVVNDFVKWVERGAADPRSQDSLPRDKQSLDRELHWSFFPRSNPPRPEVKDTSWPRDLLDDFVLAQIEKSGYAPTNDADSRTLVRRLYYDLLGLPPTVEQVDSFVADHNAYGLQAVERLVDSLLAQPQFGERWGRHWLDVARYAESNGDDGLGRNATFPHAWRYRDYVIDALNRDVPYDQFLTEQIAGDLLPADSAEQRNRQLVATGFLAIGSKPASAMNNNFAMDIVDDQINAVCTAVMGLSVACARCHDHKHDPIPTSDYYAMAGIFKSTETLYGLAANEKLTAPPTALHELKSVWMPKQAKTDAESASLQFPETYTGVVDDLNPYLHARFDAKPDSLKVPDDVAYSPQSFATLKTHSMIGQLPENSEDYSVSFWFKNDLPNGNRPITAYLFSRGEFGNKDIPGDHIGIGGNHEAARTGKLFVFNGNKDKQSAGGSTVITKGSWNHVVLTRHGNRIKLFLNGNETPEIDAELAATFGSSQDYCLGSRSDAFAPLEGNLAEFAIFNRGLSDENALTLQSASGRPKGVRALGVAMGVRDQAKPEDCKIHINGESGKLGPSVPRGFLSAYALGFQHSAAEQFSDPPSIDAGQSGRLQLAAWLTQPEHPQTARVMVNRIWLHLFGQGIVTTPDDFGVYGARPTHPELLDHLAERFVNDGWSIKRMIRSIVLSRTYQLDSDCSESLAQADPENKLFARHLRRRLDAESLRDSLLSASGNLELSPGKGSAIENTNVLINWPPGEATNLHRSSNHRSVYLCMLRHAPPAELAAFDLPDAVKVMGQRNLTTLPGQTLFLLNSEFVVDQSQALADDVLSVTEWDESQKVRELFQRVLQRSPTDSELQQSLQYIHQMADQLERSDRGAEQLSESAEPVAESQHVNAWASFCQALFTTNEFRYID